MSIFDKYNIILKNLEYNINEFKQPSIGNNPTR